MGWIFKNKKTPGEAPIKRDFVKNKIALRGKNKKAFFIALFLVSVFLGLGKFDQTHANVLDKVLTDPFMVVIKTLLVFVLNICGWLFSIAATLFAWMVDPANISGSNGLLNKQAVKDVWIMVRDLLNMMFILVLLFAAFCTIFQVDKWNLKKVWLNILINALLVNFSFPIARFFIDISNVAFYYLLNNLFTSTTTVTGSGVFALFGASSGISEFLAPKNYANYDVAYLIVMIVVVFIMGMTLMVIAALFTVRLIALAIIIMFSPIGFVGYILPATSKWADKWWNNLFSYSFFAPIMIFFMAVAIKISEAIGKENMQSFRTNASANASPDQSNWIAQSAFMFIPVIILWMGIGFAKSMGVEGADKVVGAVKSGGKWLSGSNYMKKNYDAFAGARKKRAEEIGKKRWGGSLGDGANNIQDKAMAKMGSESAMKRYDKRVLAGNKDDIKDDAEKLDGKEMPVLKSEIETAMSNRANLNDKQKTDFAVNAKIALARGAKYETEMENDFKTAMGANADVNHVDYGTFTTNKQAHTNSESAYNTKNAELAAIKSAGPGAGKNGKADYQIKLANWTAEMAQLKDAKEKAKKAVDAEEKRILNKKKTEHLDALRKAIQTGEDVGRIKPRT